MLTLSSLGAVSDEFMDCMAVDGNLELCQTLHPQSAPAASSIWNSNPTAENACGYNAWWDGARCQPFDMPTAGMQCPQGSFFQPSSADYSQGRCIPLDQSQKQKQSPVVFVAAAAAIGLAALFVLKRRAT